MNRTGFSWAIRKVLFFSFALSVATYAEEYQVPVPLGLDERVPSPEDNLLTAEKVELGRRLFFDKRLSRDRTIACASCHLAQRAFTDGKRLATGVEKRLGVRNAPTLFNRAYGVSFFWDGRVTSLEEQALEAIQGRAEMDMTLDELKKRLTSIEEYTDPFEQVFGDKPRTGTSAKAIAAFVRTLFSGNSPFDKFEHGDRAALSAVAKWGFEIFRGKGNYIACHLGPNSRTRASITAASPGEMANCSIQGDSKSPASRRIKEPSRLPPRARWLSLHDGSIATLEDVIEFYDQGGNPNPYLDPELRRLRLTAEEKEALLSFLKSLSGEISGDCSL